MTMHDNPPPEAGLAVTPDLTIPWRELTFTAARSGGPGGQHVNKVATAVTLIFDLAHCQSLPPEAKATLLERLAPRLTQDGVLRLTARSSRSQAANKAEVLARFMTILRAALTPRTPRRKTRISLGAKVRRRADKRHQAGTKAGRRRPEPEDE